MRYGGGDSSSQLDSVNNANGNSIFKRSITTLAPARGGTATGYRLMGTVKPFAGPGNPTAALASPNTETGTSQAFTYRFGGPMGGILVHSATGSFDTVFDNPAGAWCKVEFHRSSRQARLYSNAATYVSEWFGTGTIANSQCGIDISQSTLGFLGSELEAGRSQTGQCKWPGRRIGGVGRWRPGREPLQSVETSRRAGLIVIANTRVCCHSSRRTAARAALPRECAHR